MDEGMGKVVPLVDHLQRFCRGHLEKDGGAAAARMISYLQDEHAPPEVSLPPTPPHDLGAEVLALMIVRDVGEFAGVLLESEDPRQMLSWSRSNLIAAIEAYRSALGVD